MDKVCQKQPNIPTRSPQLMIFLVPNVRPVTADVLPKTDSAPPSRPNEQREPNRRSSFTSELSPVHVRQVACKRSESTWAFRALFVVGPLN